LDKTPSQPLRPKTIGVVLRSELEQETFTALPVWGLYPHEDPKASGATAQEALSELERYVKTLGYEPRLTVFATTQDAEKECLRRYYAKEILGNVAHESTLKRLFQILGKDSTKTTRVLAHLEEVAQALRSVINGSWDDPASGTTQPPKTRKDSP